MEAEEADNKNLDLIFKSLSREVVTGKTVLPESSQPFEKKITKGQEVTSEEKLLPEELVERILAMVPFPYVFKARALSKSWLARFSSLASLQHDDEKKCLAVSFQKRIIEWNKWETLCPVAYSCKAGLMGYDRASQTWRRMPSLSFLPKIVLRALECYKGSDKITHSLQMDGALLLVTIRPVRLNDNGLIISSMETESREYLIYVANILTRRWKQLPPCPQESGPYAPPPGMYYQKKLVSESSGSYKVIAVAYNVFGQNIIHIYNSTSGAWNSKKRIISPYYDLRAPAAYGNGFLYMIGNHPLEYMLENRPATEELKLVVVNVEEETLEELNIPVEAFHVPRQLCYTGGPNLYWESAVICPVICNNDLLMIVFDGCVHLEEADRAVPHVVKVNVGLRTVVELDPEAPRRRALQTSASYYESMFKAPVSDGDCIFSGISHENWSQIMVGYNVNDNEWSTFPFAGTFDTISFYHWIGSSFRPGFNPFVEV